jgi:hypothetical protein
MKFMIIVDQIMKAFLKNSAFNINHYTYTKLL